MRISIQRNFSVFKISQSLVKRLAGVIDFSRHALALFMVLGYGLVFQPVKSVFFHFQFCQTGFGQNLINLALLELADDIGAGIAYSAVC